MLLYCSYWLYTSASFSHPPVEKRTEVLNVDSEYKFTWDQMPVFSFVCFCLCASLSGQLRASRTVELSAALSTGWCTERLCWNIIILQTHIKSPWQQKIVKHQWSGARLNEAEWNSSDFRKSNRAVLWKGREQNEESWQTTALNEIHRNIFWLGIKLGKGMSFLSLQKLEVLYWSTGSFSDYVTRV